MARQYLPVFFELVILLHSYKLPGKVVGEVGLSPIGG